MGDLYDREELQDLIRELKLRKKELLEGLNGNEEESILTLRKKVVELGDKAVELKKEYNVAGAIDVVRFFKDDTGDNVSMAEGGGAGGSTAQSNSVKPITDKTFVEANAKLEIKILNKEMNDTLPSLESSALAMEHLLGNMQTMMEKAQKKEAGIPLYMMKSHKELQEEASTATESKLKKKALLRAEVEAALQRKIGTRSEILRLRQKLKNLADEEILLREGSNRLRSILAADQGRIESLNRAHLRLRRELFSTTRDWATAAFRQAVGLGPLPDDNNNDTNKGNLNTFYDDMEIAEVDWYATIPSDASLPMERVPRAVLPWVAHDASRVITLGGPTGTFKSGTTLGESLDSTNTLGAEEAILKFFTDYIRDKEEESKGSTPLPVSMNLEMFIAFCEWLER